MRRNWAVRVAGFVPFLLLAGCGGGGGSEIESLRELAASLEEAGFACDDIPENESEELFVREGGSCEIDGEDVHLYTFNDAENRDLYLDAAKQFGGGPYVVGETWLVEASDQQQAEAMAQKLSAEVE